MPAATGSGSGHLWGGKRREYILMRVEQLHKIRYMYTLTVYVFGQYYYILYSAYITV